MATGRLSPIPSIASSHQQQAPEFTPPASPEQKPFGHGKAWTSFESMGVPVNKFINKVGSEAFWPTGLEDESDKAARILKSFCKEGIQAKNIHTDPQPPLAEKNQYQPQHELSLNTNINNPETTPLINRTSEDTPPPLPPRGPRKTSPAILKIPSEIIHNALGLAVFTTFRAGTWGASLAAGSGVLIARDLNARQWSSPSAIGISTLGVGFLTGIDVADCVIVINTVEALEKFKSMRLSLGGEVTLTAGPWGAGRGAHYSLGRHTHTSGRIARVPIYTYVKSRGLYAGMQLDGTVIGVRSDENAKFYGERVSVEDVLTGRVKRWTELSEVLGGIDATRPEGPVEIARMMKEERKQASRQEVPQLTYAPVLLEFDDRRGQQKGEDGAWHASRDEWKSGEVEKEPSVKNVKTEQKTTTDKEKLELENMDRYA